MTRATASSVACTGTHCSTNRASRGPHSTSVGTATISPKSSVRPRSAPRASMATSGPGWGGTRPWRMDRPASAGMPTRIKGTSVRRATRMTTGTRSTTPTSKKRGSPRMAAMRAIAHGSPRAPTLPMMVSTIVSAPPESASSAPIIAPRPISRPTAPTVPPKPVVKLVTMSSGATPATIPITAVPSISARKGCIFTQNDEHHHSGDAEQHGEHDLGVGGVSQVRCVLGERQQVRHRGDQSGHGVVPS